MPMFDISLSMVTTRQKVIIYRGNVWILHLSVLDKSGKEQFEQVISAFQGDMSAAAAQLSIDPRLRLEYSRLI